MASSRTGTSRALALVLLWPGFWLACSSASSDSAGNAGFAGRTGATGGSGGSAGSASGGAAFHAAGASPANAGAGQGFSGSAGAASSWGGAAGAPQGFGGAAGSAGGLGGAAGAGHAGSGQAGAGAAGAPSKPLDVTFYVVADTHADPPPSSDLQPMARAINAVAKTGTWPAKIDGQDTHFKSGSIGKPRGVVFVGDLTGWGTANTEITTFRHYFEAGNSGDSIGFPSYLGLGNHDIDSADRQEPTASQFRALEWGQLDARHKGPNAPVPVTNYDAASHDYSFDFDRVHLIQLNRFGGDVQYGNPSGWAFLSADLKKYAADGRPVILFQHYGMDPFGTQERWWTEANRTTYRNALKGYHVAGVIVGHTHAAFNYDWQNLRVYQVNNAKAEIGTGNDDGNGSFSIVHISGEQMDVVTCRWLDADGKYELIQPYASVQLDTGAVP